MKKQVLLVLAATLAVFAAHPGYARGGGGSGGGMGSGAMGSGGRAVSQGQYGTQAPDSARQTRSQTRDSTQAQSPVRDQDRDRIHQPVASDSIIQQ